MSNSGKTTMIILCGHSYLKIYIADPDKTEYWLPPSHLSKSLISQIRASALALIWAIMCMHNYGHIQRTSSCTEISKPILVLKRIIYSSLFVILQEPRDEAIDIIQILTSVCDVLIYLHEKRIIHCYVNSYSVFFVESFKPKLCNSEYVVERWVHFWNLTKIKLGYTLKKIKIVVSKKKTPLNHLNLYTYMCFYSYCLSCFRAGVELAHTRLRPILHVHVFRA